MARLTAPAMAETAEPGVSLAKALRLAAAFELGRRVAARAARPRERMCTSAAVARWFSARIGTLAHEELWVLSLDGQNGLRGARRVAQGGLHGCAVTARDILRVALADAAAAIVLVHNHPSGDPAPSVDDVAMTRAVADAAHVVGVPLVDHVIVTGSERRFASLLDLGLLEPAPASRCAAGVQPTTSSARLRRAAKKIASGRLTSVNRWDTGNMQKVPATCEARRPGGRCGRPAMRLFGLLRVCAECYAALLRRDPRRKP